MGEIPCQKVYGGCILPSSVSYPSLALPFGDFPASGISYNAGWRQLTHSTSSSLDETKIMLMEKIKCHALLSIDIKVNYILIFGSVQ